MTERVGLGSIGLGWWGKELATAVGSVEGADIVSCFARREEGRREFADKFDCRSAESLDELLADPEVDGVLVATSHESHRELVERAAAAGKAIFVDKPLTTTVSEGLAAVEAAEAAGVVLQVGHQRRRNAANRRIHQLIEEGRLGDIEGMEGTHTIPNGFTMAADAWRWDQEQSPLGAMTSLGIHKIDSMRYHAGPVRAISCMTRPGRDHPIDEATVLILEFEAGAVGTIFTSFFVPRVSQLSVYGQAAAAYSTDDGKRLHLQQTGSVEREEIALDPVDPVADQLAEFASAIRGDTTPEVGGREGLEIVAILESAVESAATGRAVEIAEHRP
ncbi:MAG TPA: Gfo/Idh/MocA family oxidoreductase [Acidimicrobiia bacterium]|jgi:predicted dehydrogenase